MSLFLFVLEDIGLNLVDLFGGFAHIPHRLLPFVRIFQSVFDNHEHGARRYITSLAVEAALILKT